MKTKGLLSATSSVARGEDRMDVWYMAFSVCRDGSRFMWAPCLTHFRLDKYRACLPRIQWVPQAQCTLASTQDCLVLTLALAVWQTSTLHSGQRSSGQYHFLVSDCPLY